MGCWLWRRGVSCKRVSNMPGGQVHRVHGPLPCSGRKPDMGSAMLEGWNVAHSERGDLAVPQQTSVERCLGFSFLQGTTPSTSFSSCLFSFSSLFSLTHSSLSAHLSLLFSSLLFSSRLVSSLLFSSLLLTCDTETGTA